MSDPIIALAKLVSIIACLAFFGLGACEMHVQEKPVHKSYGPIESPLQNDAAGTAKAAR